MSGPKSTDGPAALEGEVYVECLVVYDKYGRVCLDRDVFFNDELLALIKREVIKNGSNSRNDLP